MNVWRVPRVLRLIVVAAALAAGLLVAPSAIAARATGVTTSCTLRSLDDPSEAGGRARFPFFANNAGSMQRGVGAHHERS
jgi:hypothetical protein